MVVQLNAVLYVGGGTLLWVEWVSLALAFGLFVLAALVYPGDVEGRDRPVGRLLRFPVFWLGLMLLGYVAIQANNVAWAYTRVGNSSVMQAVPGVREWLPQGFVAPLDYESPFRWMLRLMPVWLTSCALWMNLRGRSGAQVALGALGGSLVLWTVVAFTQFVMAEPKMLWIWEVRMREPRGFWGTFVNANHGALMLVLGQALLLGLFLQGMRSRFQRTLSITGPHLLYLPLALLLAAGVVPSGSRGALSVTVVLWAVFFILGTIALWQLVRGRALMLPILALCLLTLGVGAVLNNPDVWTRAQRALTQMEQTLENVDSEARTWVNRMGMDMVRDKPLFGVGAGGWRYFYPAYQINYPELATTRNVLLRDPVTHEIVRNERGRAQWRTIPIWFRQLHNDWLELVVELGWAGASLVLVGILWWIIALLWISRGKAAVLMLACGPLALMTAGLWEFHFRLPAPLLWVGVTMVLVLIWARSPERRKT